MTRLMGLAGLALLMIPMAAAAVAPPGISQNGIVNAASYIPSVLPGGAIARGARFAILGVHLGSSEHTIVTLTHGNSAMPVKVLNVSMSRIDARMPDSVPIGAATVTVVADGKPSKPFPLEIVASNPGIYSHNEEGWGRGRIDNLDSAGGASPNSYTKPARPEQMVRFTVTGLGDATQATVVIGGRSVKAARVQRGSAGDDQISVRVPRDVPAGCNVPLYLMEAQPSNVVTVAIRAGGGECDSGAVPRLSGGRVGIATLFRTNLKMERKNAESIHDDTKIVFLAMNRDVNLPPLMLLPPAGLCTTYTSRLVADGVINSLTTSLGASGPGLRAGNPLTITRGGEKREIPLLIDGVYHSGLGTKGATAKRGEVRPFLDPGELELSSAGGADVGAFSVKLTAPPHFEWTDREQTDVIDRSRGATVHWKGAGSDRLVLIIATNVEQITTATATAMCVAKPDAGEFKIPAAMLAHIPATQDIPGVPFDQLYVTTIPAKTAVPTSIQGLDAMLGINVFASVRVVTYR